MDLKSYFKKYPVKKAFLAKGIGVSPSFITYLAQGKKFPSAKIAARIETATHGLVTRMELLYPKG